jgi:hypothetical protein
MPAQAKLRTDNPVLSRNASHNPANGRKRYQCSGRTVMATKDYRPTKKSPASEATRAGQSPVGSGPVRTVDSGHVGQGPQTLEVRATRTRRPAALSLEPISRPRLYRIDHNSKFSWGWPTVWRTSRQFGSNRGKRTFDTR